MLEMSYKYISSSSTTASRFRLSRTARTAEGNVSSQIIEERYNNISRCLANRPKRAVSARISTRSSLPLYSV